MKTAISVPDEIFAEAERLAKRLKRSRSELYSRALAEYLSRHATDQVTEAMNEVLAGVEESADSFTTSAARRELRRNEW
jgi:metal-responsive CopG/Arc/MetJ family transcriptional regulator